MSEFGDMGEYIPLGERMQKIVNATPDRFKRVPALRENNHDKWAQRRKCTEAKAPRFATDARANRMREAREAARGHAQPKKERKVRGAPNLSTANRAKYHSKPEAETFNTEFKARPMPTIRNTRAVSRASSFCSVGPTKQDPFSFDSRPRKKKEVIIPEPVAKKFHEPGSLPASIDKPSGVPKKAPMAATKLQAFNFATDSVSRTIANRTMEAPTFLPNVKKSNEEFMKKALHGHAKVAPVSKPVTRPLSPGLATSSRAVDRNDFNEGLEAKQAEFDEVNRILEEAKQKEDEKDVKQLRKNLVHKPTSVPKFAPVPQRLTIPTTLPVTPTYGGPRTRSRRPKR